MDISIPGGESVHRTINIRLHWNRAESKPEQALGKKDNHNLPGLCNTLQKKLKLNSIVFSPILASAAGGRKEGGPVQGELNQPPS